MLFNFGKAPFFILVLAVVTGLGVLYTHERYVSARPDLVLMTHASFTPMSTWRSFRNLSAGTESRWTSR